MIKSLIFNILGIVCLKLPVSGLFAKILALFGAILILIGTLIALIKFIMTLPNIKQNIPSFIISLISLSLGIYGIIQTVNAIPLIKSIF